MPYTLFGNEIRHNVSHDDETLHPLCRPRYIVEGGTFVGHGVLTGADDICQISGGLGGDLRALLIPHHGREYVSAAHARAGNVSGNEMPDNHSKVYT